MFASNYDLKKLSGIPIFKNKMLDQFVRISVNVPIQTAIKMKKLSDDKIIKIIRYYLEKYS